MIRCPRATRFLRIEHSPPTPEGAARDTPPDNCTAAVPCAGGHAGGQAGSQAGSHAGGHAGSQAGSPSRPGGVAVPRVARFSRSISIAGVTTSVSTVAMTRPPAMALESSVQYCVDGAPKTI